jgi:hypothetical protein
VRSGTELEAKNSGGGEQEKEDKRQHMSHYSASCREPRGGHYVVDATVFATLKMALTIVVVLP